MHTITFGGETIKVIKNQQDTYLELRGHIAPLSEITAFIESPIQGPHSITNVLKISRINNTIKIGCLEDTYFNFIKLYKQLKH